MFIYFFKYIFSYMSTYYELLNINYDASNMIIRKAYKNRISFFKNKMLTTEDIQNIKQLKTALFILENIELRNNYDKLILNNNLENNESPKIEDINALNNYDNLYTELNMQEMYQDIPNIHEEINNNDIYDKQNRINEKNVILSNRIFDNSFNNNKIIVNTFKPMQTREDRKLS